MTDRGDRTSLGTGNRLKIGLFAANCSEGRAITRAPDRWLASWPDNLELARLADEAGIDFMLPIGRWKGYGGETDHQGTTFETLTWASGLLSATKRIHVFGTVHTPLFHPVIAAKQMVTADHIGQGRFGLNIVCGWSEGEFEMFGMTQREHTDRYAHGQEWIDVIRAMWERGDDFDFEGEYFSLKGVRSKPKPYRGTRPFLMNAGRSDDGRAFACRNCDGLFTSMPYATQPADVTREIAAVKAQAEANGNVIGIFMTGSVICRPTKQEADEYCHYALVENADWEAIDAMIDLRGHVDLSRKERDELRERYSKNAGGFALVGSPDDIAGEFAKIAAVGATGVAFSLVKYLDDFPYLRDEVLPRLERLGLRTAR